MKSEPFDFKDDVQLSNSTTMQNPKTTFCVHVACRLLKMTSGCLTSTNVSKCISWLHYQNSKTVSCGIPSEKNNKMCTLLVVDGRCVQKEERKLCRCGRWVGTIRPVGGWNFQWQSTASHNYTKTQICHWPKPALTTRRTVAACKFGHRYTPSLQNVVKMVLVNSINSCYHTISQ